MVRYGLFDENPQILYYTTQVGGGVEVAFEKDSCLMESYLFYIKCTWSLICLYCTFGISQIDQLFIVYGNLH